MSNERREWTSTELKYAVDDYFDMLKSELRGESYNKAMHNRVLRTKLDRRSRGSVEFRHQNISWILDTNGYSYISGYKPRSNIHHDLTALVLEAAAIADIPVCRSVSGKQTL